MNYTGYNGDIKMNKRISTPYGNGTVKGYFNGLVVVLIGCEKYRVKASWFIKRPDLTPPSRPAPADTHNMNA
jgi:hypothetical protein